MQLSEYQRAAHEFAVYPEVVVRGVAVVPIPGYPLMGLTGEVGEYAEKVKKCIRDDQGIFSPGQREDIKKELGDILWYLCENASFFNFDMNEIAAMNINKLRSRRDRNKLGGSGDNR